jgi:hypothetical protein
MSFCVRAKNQGRYIEMLGLQGAALKALAPCAIISAGIVSYRGARPALRTALRLRCSASLFAPALFCHQKHYPEPNLTGGGCGPCANPSCGGGGAARGSGERKSACAETMSASGSRHRPQASTRRAHRFAAWPSTVLQLRV